MPAGSLKKYFFRNVATVVLVSTYWFGVFVSRLLGHRKKENQKQSGKILVIATFLNPNWFFSHIGPLARSGVGEVILVCDRPVAEMEGVRYACPPALLSKFLSRAGGKFLWAIFCGFRHTPDVYMGYHIFPGALSALIIARLFNRPSCYQDTSGPLELEGGGWHAENRILVALGGPSKVVEKFVFKLIQEFDLIVVRGTKAGDFIRQTGYKNKLAIITGSIEEQNTWLEQTKREIDIVFVGRLTEYKRPDRFVSVIAKIAQKIPNITVVAIGEGPDKEQLIKQAENLGIKENIQFVGKIRNVPEKFSKSKIYILTSRWEGVSIAMMEAMAAGTVPVVSDVGDLRDFVEDGKNGYVNDGDDITAYSDSIIQLLTDEALWSALSRAAVRTAVERSSISVISKSWEQNLKALRSCDVR